MAEELVSQLNCETLFTIPILGGIDITESIVITWGIIALLFIISVLLTRNLKVENPSKRQLLLESAITWVYTTFDDIIGKSNRKYVPYLCSVMIYLAMANTIVSILGFKPPTKDINITIALALMSMILIEASSIRKNGAGVWAKSFGKPVAVVSPIMILEIGIRPLSLCMRLFGNVLGAFIIMELIKIAVPAVIPAVCSLYFDMFDGLLQAYIFVFLTAVFMNEEMDVE